MNFWFVRNVFMIWLNLSNVCGIVFLLRTLTRPQECKTSKPLCRNTYKHRSCIDEFVGVPSTT